KAEAERKRIEAAKKQAEAERKRIEAAKKKAEAERKRIEAAKKKAEAERKRIEAAKKKAEAERKRIEEARRKEAERALQEQIARDYEQLERERLALLDAGRIEYIAQIKDKIERNWLRPPGTATGLTCVVRVSQIPGGEVVQAEIRTSSGNIAFDRSVEEAVLRSSPLPIPKDPSLFDRHIMITFEPEV
ncbi:MAG: cell envelope integrity protein TolA, partial [Thiotrichales bacterium]|nr:cell envelope integrity protein TolA [Thiotrichales bacterium]